jgi:hypothetical protein
MYTAQQIEGTFAITHNGNGKMRARGKMGIVNLIMSNRYAAYLLSIVGHVIITFEDDARYVEMTVTKCQGLIYIRNVVTLMKGE